MAGREKVRLLLRADPDLLAGFDGESVLADTQAYMRQLRDDIDVTLVDRRSPDSVGVVLAVPTIVTGGEISELAQALRRLWGIGPGDDVLEGGRASKPIEPGSVRGVGGEGSECTCGEPDGLHLPGCRLYPSR